MHQNGHVAPILAGRMQLSGQSRLRSAELADRTEHMKNMTRILGLDPGLRRLGWGLVDVEGARLSWVAHGVIEPPQDEALSVRLLHLFDALGAVIAQWTPDEAAIEETFVNMNPSSTLKLGHARAAAMLAPAKAGIMDATAMPEDAIPSGWNVYFCVADVDQALIQVAELGGTVVMPAEDTPYGRLATAADPTGARFRLIGALVRSHQAQVRYDALYPEAVRKGTRATVTMPIGN